MSPSARPVPGRSAAPLFCLLLALSLRPAECGVAAAAGGAAYVLRGASGRLAHSHWSRSVKAVLWLVGSSCCSALLCHKGNKSLWHKRVVLKTSTSDLISHCEWTRPIIRGRGDRERRGARDSDHVPHGSAGGRGRHYWLLCGDVQEKKAIWFQHRWPSE